MELKLNCTEYEQMIDGDGGTVSEIPNSTGYNAREELLSAKLQMTKKGGATSSVTNEITTGVTLVARKIEGITLRRRKEFISTYKYIRDFLLLLNVQATFNIVDRLDVVGGILRINVIDPKEASMRDALAY